MKARLFFIFIAIAGGGFTLSPSKGLAQALCAPGEMGIEVQFSEASVANDQRVMDLLEEVDMAVRTTRSAAIQFDGARNYLRTVKNKIQNTLAEVAQTSGGMTRNLISNFFYGVSELMRLAAEEKKADNKLLEEIANEFKLTLDQRDYLDVFPLADGLVPGVEAKYGSGKIELKLNQFHKLSVLKKMASRLPGRTEDSTKAYVETARCSLVPELLNKITLHSVLGDVKNDLSAFQNENACLSMPFKDIYSSTTVALSGFLGETRKQQLIVNTPSLDAIVADNEELKKLNDKYGRFGQSIDYTLLYPSRFFAIIQKLRNDNKDVSEEEFKKFHAGMMAAISEFEKSNPFFTRSQGFWKEPEFREILKEIIPCRLSVMPTDIDVLAQELSQAERIYLALSFRQILLMTPLDLNQFSKKEFQAIVTDLYLRALRRTVLASLEVTLERYQNLDNAIAGDIFLELQPKLIAAFYEVVNRRQLDRDAVALAGQVTEKVFAKTADLSQVKLALIDEALRDEAGKLVEFDKNHDTPEKYPYSASTLAKYFAPTVANLANPFGEMMSLLVGSRTWAEQKAVWEKLEPILKTDAQKKGYECQSTKFERIWREIKTMFPGSSPTGNQRASSDCENIYAIISLMGLDRDKEPENLGVVLPLWKEKYPEKEFNSFLDFYFKYLRANIVANARILDFPVENGGSEPTPLYKVLGSLTAADAQQKIKEAFRQTIHPLKVILEKVLKAQKAEDFGPVVTNSKILNNLFGETDLKNFISDHTVGLEESVIRRSDDSVFPKLIGEHTRIQNKMIGRLSYNDRLWDAIYAQLGEASTYLIVGWLAKGFLLHLGPGGKFLSTPLQRIADGARPLITGYWFSLWGGITVDWMVLTNRISSYQGEREELNGLLSLDPITAEDQALFRYESFLRQNLMIEAQIKSFEERRTFDMWFMASLPVLYGSLKLYQAPLFKGAESLATKTGRASDRLLDRSRFFNSLSSGMSRMRMRVFKNNIDYTRRMLGARSLEVSEMHAALLQAERVAKSQAEIERLRKAYYTAVQRMYERVERARGFPQKERIAAEALYGKGASRESLQRLFKEYDRLLEQKVFVW